LQEHPDALLTATVDTARHPIAEHPEWDLGFAGEHPAIIHDATKQVEGERRDGNTHP
jgi:hypothetical protein